MSDPAKGFRFPMFIFLSLNIIVADPAKDDKKQKKAAAPASRMTRRKKKKGPAAAVRIPQGILS